MVYFLRVFPSNSDHWKFVSYPPHLVKNCSLFFYFLILPLCFVCWYLTLSQCRYSDHMPTLSVAVGVCQGCACVHFSVRIDNVWLRWVKRFFSQLCWYCHHYRMHANVCMSLLTFMWVSKNSRCHITATTRLCQSVNLLQDFVWLSRVWIFFPSCALYAEWVVGFVSACVCVCWCCKYVSVEFQMSCFIACSLHKY